jgi:regulator of replication initiation timing
MVNEAILIAVIGLLAAPIASFITWMANRKKNTGDIYATLTDSASSAIDYMQDAMTTLHHELDKANDKIESLIQENQNVTAELSKLRQQNLLLLQENHALHQKIDDLAKAFQLEIEHPSISDEQ